MNLAQFGLILLWATGACVVVVSLNAAVDWRPRSRTLRRQRRGVRAASACGEVAAWEPELPLSGPAPYRRLRNRATVFALALGMAVTIDRTLEDRAVESWHGQAAWVAIMLPAGLVSTTRTLRVQTRTRPR